MRFNRKVNNRLLDSSLWLCVSASSHECMRTSGRTQQEFDEFFWKTPLGQYIGKAGPEMQMEFYQRYLQDFVCMTMNVTCPEDLKVSFLLKLTLISP